MLGDILSPTHLLFILAVALLVLGPKRLPEAGRALGKGIRDFRMAVGGEEDRADAIPTAAPAPPPAPVVAVAPSPEPATTEPIPHPVEGPAEPTEAEAEPAHPVG